MIGIDLGGTKILAALVGPRGEILSSPVEVATPRGASTEPGPADGVPESSEPESSEPAKLRDSAAEERLERAIVSAARAAGRGYDVRAVGLAAAGFIDAAGERVEFAPHLPWRAAPVRRRLSAALGLPVALENDATCAGVAEFRVGAARTAGSMVLLTVGTGIGGALGMSSPGGERFVWRGATGMAAEFGHMQVVPEGRECPCGLRGCLEQYCSGRALARAALDRGAPVADGAAAGSLEHRARAGDPAALAAFEEVGTWLGVGIASVCAGIDPDVVVIGGGVARTGELLLAPARRALADHAVGPHRPPPPVVAAEFVERAGLIGAGLLAHDLLAQ